MREHDWVKLYADADKFMKKVIGKAKLKPGWEEMK